MNALRTAPVSGRARRIRLPAPFGKLELVFDAGDLVEIILQPGQSVVRRPAGEVDDPIAAELARYFVDPTYQPRIPLRPNGTPFQRRVWKALQQIPTGRVKSYAELAAELDSGPRAVAAACRANPVPIVVPCHRVVGHDGLGGYGGHTDGPMLAIKRWLLRHEGVPMAGDGAPARP